MAEGGPIRGYQRRDRAGPYDRPSSQSRERMAPFNEEPLQVVSSNYILLEVPDDKVVYSYHVKFDPEVENRRIRRSMVYEQRERIGATFVFDGGANLKCLIKFPNFSFQVQHHHSKETITVTLTFTEEIGYGSPEMFRLYNTQMRRNFDHLGFKFMARKYYDEDDTVDFNQFGVKMMRGFETAIAQHSGGILMSVDPITKVVWNKTMLELMGEIKNAVESKRIRADSVLHALKAQLVGKSVMTNYSHKSYRIDDITTQVSPRSTFHHQRDGDITYIDYYQRAYNIEIRSQGQPLLVVQPSARDQRAGRVDPILLIPELCLLTGMSDELRENRDFKSKLAEFSNMTPAGRFTAIRDFGKKLVENQNVQDEMKNWGIKFKPGFVKPEAKVFPPEEILMNETSVGRHSKGMFTNNIQNHRMTNPGPALEKWALVYSNRCQQGVDKFKAMFPGIMNGLGISGKPPREFQTRDDSNRSYIETLNSIVGHRPLLIVVVLPDKNKDRYDAVKRLLYCDHGISSQCFVAKTLQRDNTVRSILINIAIQMSAKLGGIPWTVKIPPQDIMVIGIDTHHSGENRNVSFGGFVASLNPNCTRWFSRCNRHQNLDELSSHMPGNVLAALKAYNEEWGKLPQKIIIYRDGVGIGQMKHVLDQEITPVKQMLLDNYHDSIKITCVVVMKRISTRFARPYNPNNPDDDRKLSSHSGINAFTNVSPGTVVDNEITLPNQYEFYMVSQSVRVGTVVPTRYFVIQDEVQFSQKNLQLLTYKICHLYYNDAKIIRIPAAVHYAHKMAKLVGLSLNQPAHMALEKFTYYI